jgi:hypothetical protein
MNHQNQSGACKICTHKNTNHPESIICSLTGCKVEQQDWCESFTQDENSSHQLNRISYKTDKEYFTQKLVSLFTGYLIGLFIGIMLIALGAIKNPDEHATIIIIGFLLTLISSVLAIIMLYNLWDFTIKESKFQGIKAPIESPGKAVGFLFIPLFNLYWIFKSIGNLPIILNKISIQRTGKSIIPHDLGIIISILTLMAFLPTLSVVFSIVNCLILLPVFYYKAIKAIDKLPYFDEKAATEHIQTDALDIKRIHDYSQLFDEKKYGINVLFGLYLFLASLCVEIIFILVRLLFHSGSLEGTMSYFMVIHLLFAISAVFLSHKIRNKLILALLVGLSNALATLAEIPFLLIYFRSDFMELLKNSYLYHIGASFIFGFFLILCTSYSIKFFGLKFRNILLSTLSFVIALNLYWFAFFCFSGEKFQLKWILLVHAVLNILFYSLAIYFSFYQYVMRTQTQGSKIARDAQTQDSL